MPIRQTTRWTLAALATVLVFGALALALQHAGTDWASIWQVAPSGDMVTQLTTSDESSIAFRPPTPAVRRLRFYILAKKRLMNVPEVVSTEMVVDSAGVQYAYQVVVQNRGTSTLSYLTNSGKFDPLRDKLNEAGILELQRWWYQCGNGLESVEIPPGEVATLVFPRDGRDSAVYRFHGLFYEAGKRMGAILLVDERKARHPHD